MKRYLLLLCLLPFLLAWQTFSTYQVEPGDTWTALAFRFDSSVDELQMLNRHLNLQRQPAIGSLINVPANSGERLGSLTRPYGNLLATAVHHNSNPWQIALENSLASPFRPVLYRPVFMAGGALPPKDLPVGFISLELPNLIAHPGQALALRGMLSEEGAVTAVLAENEMDSFTNGRHFVALTGTGAFFGGGQP
jgi:hypothetical protein